MRHLIIYTHPNPASYNNAILKIVTELLQKNGHKVMVRDLYAIGFDPVLKAKDFISFAKGVMPEDIGAEQSHIGWADIITFIFPIWWFGMPANLKGYIDRVFAKGFAYDFVDNEVKGLLTGKKVIVLNTTGGKEQDYNRYGFNDGVHTTIDNGTFGLCGMEVIYHKFFYAVPSVEPDVRKRMLEEFRQELLSYID